VESGILAFVQARSLPLSSLFIIDTTHIPFPAAHLDTRTIRIMVRESQKEQDEQCKKAIDPLKQACASAI
jgi:hypothetical protein